MSDITNANTTNSGVTEKLVTRSGVEIVRNGHVHKLLQSAQEDWEQAVQSRFVKELFAGTLDDDVLARYLVQDYQFFDAFISMIGASVAYADKIGPKLRYSAQLGMLADDEDSYFQDSFKELGVPQSEQENPELTDTTAAFNAAMNKATDSQDYAHLLVVLVIAEWIYLDWGELDLGQPERSVHYGWVDLHKGDDFRGWVQYLVDELERVFPADDAEAAQHLTEVWQEVVGYERDFFEVCYK